MPSRPILLALLVSISGTAGALDGAALLRQVDRNLEPESYEMYRKLVNVEPDGRKKEFVLYSVKKGRDKVAALFLSPASDRGRATLRLGDNMWLFIPDVGKPVRITSLQSVVGGVFNNADILRLDYAEEYAVEAAREEGSDYVLDLRAKTGAVAYERLKMWVDRATALPRVIEAYAGSGMLIKTITFKDVQDFGDGVRRPAAVETESPVHQGYRSVMLFSQLKRREVPDEVFTLSYLPRLQDVRR